MTTITVIAPAKVAVPRAAPVAAALFLSFLSWLQRVGEARTARVKAAELAAEAARVRVHAYQMARHDPRLAADLLAAVDRHERLG